MTGGALPSRVVVGAGLVTGQAEGPVGSQQAHGRRGVAGGTGAMRGRYVFLVRPAKLLTLVTSGAGAIGGVMVLVAITTAPSGCRWRHGDRLGMALDTAKLGVSDMREAHRTRAGRTVSNRDRHRDDSRLLALLQ